MTSKEALKELRACAISKWGIERLKIIEKDLDLLEKLEIENDELKRINGAYQESNIVFQDLIKKFKKAFDKACERLDWSCPTEQDLVDDFDCENCKDDYKECWKKYFLNEVLKNE